MTPPTYRVAYLKKVPDLEAEWTDLSWSSTHPLDVDRFHANSSDHHPMTQARLGFNDDGLSMMFRVEDQYVKSVHTEYQDSVCRDSCVEFFVEPIPGKGYLNFEFNAGGTLLLYHVEDTTLREDGSFTTCRTVDKEHIQGIRIHTSLPSVVNPEITDPVTWTLAAYIPYSVFASYVGELNPKPGDVWRGNFYKCGDSTSHPHWASWSPIGEVLGFHKPQCFGTLEFIKAVAIQNSLD